MALSKKNLNVKTGYMGSPNVISQYSGDFGADPQNEQCLADALVAVFFKSNRMKWSPYTFDTVIAKLKSEFGEDVALVLHVDEYSRSINNVQALLRGAAVALRDRGFCVTLVLTGMKPSEALELNTASCFSLVPCVLAPLLDQVLVNQSVAGALGIEPEVKWDNNLYTLVEMCGGYPASLEALVQELKYFKDQTNLKTSGWVSCEDAKKVYSSIQYALSVRYGQQRWSSFFPSTSKVPTVAYNEYGRFIDAKALLRRVALISTARLLVDPDCAILEQPNYADVTYRQLEPSGLMTLEPAGNGIVFVGMPLLAIGAMNKADQFVDWDMLENPFEVTFSAQERLALASLSLRLRALTELHGVGALRSVSELRPGATMVVPQGESKEKLKIRLPKSLKCLYLGTLIKNGKLHLDFDGQGDPPSSEDGTILMMATDEQAIDGVAVLSGKRGDQDVLVVFLSQSIKPTTDVSSGTLDNGLVTGVLTGMEVVGNRLLEIWLDERVKKGAKVEFVCDLFSDKELGPGFRIGDVVVESPRNPTVLFLTSRSQLKEVVGPVLHVRGSLKRSVDPAATAVKKKKRVRVSEEEE